MKQLFTLLIAFLLPLFSYADFSGTCGDGLTFTYDESTQTLTISGNGAMSNFYYSVPWNTYKKSINTVIIEDGVTSIGSYAFKDCSVLSFISIPGSVESIGEEAFYGCRSLTSITIPESVTNIEKRAFGSCSGLSKVELNSNAIVSKNYWSNTGSVVEISSLINIFGNQVKEYIIGDKVESIGDFAFKDCSGLTSVTMSKSVTSIGIYSFENCNGLTSITIPENVTSIGYGTFSGCGSLTSITISNSVTSIGGGAFGLCSGLTSITIPESVTCIEELTFWGCSGLTSFTIPENVTSIGNEAFYNCSGLISITIPNSVNTIGDEAFTGCSSLSRVELNSNAVVSNAYSSVSSLKNIFGSQVTDYILGDKVECIGDYAFDACGELISISIPESVTSIGNSSFSGCSGLSSITIPSSVTHIGANAFNGCSNLTRADFKSIEGLCRIKFSSAESNPLYYAKHLYINDQEVTNVNIPQDVKSIGNYAFAGCRGLMSVSFPNSEMSIGENAFYQCSALTSITIPESVTNIGNCAFGGCNSLSKVELNSNAVVSKAYSSSSSFKSIFGSQVTEYILSDKVESIGDYAFYCCSSLTSFTIPNSVTTLGDYSFSGCSGLTSIVIPESVTSIGTSAFSGCSGLTRAEFKSLESLCGIKYNSMASNPLYLAKHLYINGQEVTNVTIPQDVTSIGDYSFTGCSSLYSITIPENVTSIGDNAFRGCSSLSRVELNSNAIVSKSYSHSSALKNVFGSRVTELIIGDNVKSIGDYAFSQCSEITSIIIPESVTSIGSHAFEYCSKLTDITIGNGVTSIGDNAFRDCRGLTSVVIGNGVMTIGDCAFLYCSGLTSISIPESVTKLGNSSFSGCSGLVSIDMSNSVTTIESGAFYQCKSLSSVTIPNSVTTIGFSAFSGCSGLISITIGKGVTSMGGEVFKDCQSLTSVNIFDVESWCKIAFDDYLSNPLYYAHHMLLNGVDITDLDIPNTVTSISDYCFYYCSSLTSVTIPESVTSIGNEAFAGCSNLETITYLSSSPFILDKAIFPTQFKTDGTLYVPAGSRQKYVERGWSGYFFNIAEMEGDETIWLTIIDAEQGCTRLKCEFRKSYSLQFEPSDGWHIHSLTYCGTDMTDGLTEDHVFTTPAMTQNAELYITYSDIATRVMSVTAESDIRVLVKGDYIVVLGAEAGTLIHVYDLNGRQITSTKAGDGETRIAVNTNEHILLIKVGEHVVKVAR